MERSSIPIRSARRIRCQFVLSWTYVRMSPRNVVGARLITSTIDHCATERPGRTHASTPRSEDLSDGFVDVTYKQLSNAINHTSWWLESELGECNGSFNNFAYAGPKDLRYPILAVAASKVGRRVNYVHLQGECLSCGLLALTTSRYYFHLLISPQRRRYIY